MRLAVLFRCAPSALPHILSGRDYREFARFYAAEPWDGMRGDVRNGILCALVAAVAGAKNAPPGEFMPFVDTKGRGGPSPDDVSVMRRAFEAQNAGMFA